MKAPLGVTKCCFICHQATMHYWVLFTLPETNRKSLYLKIDFVGRLSSIFLGRLGLFSGANLLLVSGRVISFQLDLLHQHKTILKHVKSRKQSVEWTDQHWKPPCWNSILRQMLSFMTRRNLKGKEVHHTRWWFQIFKYFLFLSLYREIIQFDEHIFQMGGNHQVAYEE